MVKSCFNCFLCQLQLITRSGATHISHPVKLEYKLYSTGELVSVMDRVCVALYTSFPAIWRLLSAAGPGESLAC